MKVTVTEELKEELEGLIGPDFWQRLGDVTEFTPEWLSQQVKGCKHCIEFPVVSDFEAERVDHGDLRF